MEKFVLITNDYQVALTTGPKVLVLLVRCAEERLLRVVTRTLRFEVLRALASDLRGHIRSRVA